MENKNIFVPLWFKISAKLDESILIERLRRNDRKAYSDLFDRYFDKLFTFTLKAIWFSGKTWLMILCRGFITIYEKSVLEKLPSSLKAYLTRACVIVAKITCGMRNEIVTWRYTPRRQSIRTTWHDWSGGDSEKIREVPDEVTGKMSGSAFFVSCMGTNTAKISSSWDEWEYREGTVASYWCWNVVSDYDFAPVLFMLTVCLENV